MVCYATPWRLCRESRTSPRACKRAHTWVKAQKDKKSLQLKIEGSIQGIGGLCKQAMMTLQGMADHRFTSVSLFTNVFLGEIFFPLIFFTLIFVY